MEDMSIYIALAVALACGLLIGLDRERVSNEYDFGGIRTYPLIALLGALSQLLVPEMGVWILGISLTGLLIWLAIYYFSQTKHNNLGMTSEFASLVTFFCGVLAMQGKLGLAFSIAIAVTLILSLKGVLHRSIKNLSGDDLHSTLKFLIVCFVVLPLLPSETYTMNVPAIVMPDWLNNGEALTLNVINPRKVGWMIVLIASISFAGFILSKLMAAQKGLGLTAFLGGLASSTAVTLSFAAKAKKMPILLNICVIGILVASTTMFFRVIIEVVAVAPDLLPSVIKPIGAMAIMGLLVSLFFWIFRKKVKAETQDIRLQNPFDLSEALKFGAFFAVVLFVADLAQKLFGDSGLYLSALLAGLTDVDAITLSVAELTHAEINPLPHSKAAFAITIAALANTVVKAGLAYAIGGFALGIRIILAFLLVAMTGILVLFL